MYISAINLGPSKSVKFHVAAGRVGELGVARNQSLIGDETNGELRPTGAKSDVERLAVE